MPKDRPFSHAFKRLLAELRVRIFCFSFLHQVLENFSGETASKDWRDAGVHSLFNQKARASGPQAPEQAVLSQFSVSNAFELVAGISK